MSNIIYLHNPTQKLAMRFVGRHEPPEYIIAATRAHIINSVDPKKAKNNDLWLHFRERAMDHLGEVCHITKIKYHWKGEELLLAMMEIEYHGKLPMSEIEQQDRAVSSLILHA